MRPRVQVLVPADSNQHNEHQNSHHNRYSYLHTPAELHAPTFPQQNHSQRSLSVPVNAAEPPVPPPLEHRAYTHPQPQPQPHTHTHTRTRTRTEAQPNPRPFSYMPSVMHHEPRSEKASLHAHTQSAPPLSEHPAHSAPYADSVENTTNNAQSQARVSQLPQQSADHTLQLSPSRDQFHQPQNSVTLSPTHSQFPQHLQQPSAALSPTYSHSAQQPPSAALSSTRDQFPQKPPTAAQEQARREKELAIVPDSNPLEPLGSPVPQTPRSPAPAYNRTMALPDHNGLNHLPGQVMHPNQRLTGDTWNYGLGDYKQGFWQQYNIPGLVVNMQYQAAFRPIAFERHAVHAAHSSKTSGR
ncbi:hypothetical protein AJ79_07370 [Helicocarpus griseus UAMH5409]|uniref:Uncharacterized protein n=1 Tax=Helicocarpus griseus UAMH5409 TaxID=1447875 RepID=A0A2B7WVJ3_9EURO|nr:hypothetical protein AJ79_07370 [Helicocarpus griseus UAMH5409]